MSITNYTELQSAVANWLTRADLTSRIPEFIALCEADMQRRLKARAMETNNTAFQITGEYVKVPNDFIEVRRFDLQISPRRALKYLSDEAQTDLYSASGCPKFYSVVGSQFRFAPPPNGTYQATLLYYAKFPPLSAACPANWLLSNHPDAYLFGTLLQSVAGPIQDDQAIQKWIAAYNGAIDGINKKDAEGRWSGSGMAVRVAGTIA